MDKKKDRDFINPLDFYMSEKTQEAAASSQKQARQKKKSSGQRPKMMPGAKNLGLFITGTDTDVGKTIATAVLGTLIKEHGCDVGVMKPIQCAGADTARLKKFLQINDSLKEINPYYAKEPLSPHVAFKKGRTKINIKRIMQAYQRLATRHEVMLVEGAGGLMVPIADDYLMADLIKEMNLELIIVARLGLGTINHTLLTINQARAKGLSIKGVIFNDIQGGKAGVAEKTNPDTIGRLSGVPVLGIIPHFEKISRSSILEKAKGRIAIATILQSNRHLDIKSQPLEEWDKRYAWHPFTQMQDWLKSKPLIIDTAKGCTLTDIHGHQYIDGISSLWVNVHGHQNPLLDQALIKQVHKLSHSTFLGASNTPAVLLAKKLVEKAPRGLAKVFYSDNGSTAVEIAIKMAYQYWQNKGNKNKTRIAHLSNAYHGDTLGSVSVGGIDLFHKVFRDLIIKTLVVEFPDFYRCPEGQKYPQYTEECLRRMEKLFAREHDTIAALIVEPLVQAAAGIIVWPKGILRRLSAICRKHDIFLIADEVATGFGRTGKMFACEHEKVTPDFLCLAKGLSGGYLPLAATLTTQKVFNGFLFPYRDQKTFFHGHTYTGNPLCCAAALANLELFDQNKTVETLRSPIGILNNRLKKFAALKHVGDVRQKGMMVGIELVRDKEKKTPYHWNEKIGIKVCQEARGRNVLLRPLGNVIVLMPPLVISKQELETLLDVTYGAIKKVTGSSSTYRRK